MNTRREFLKLAGAAFVGVTGVASAGENPFGFVQIKSGYAQVATEGSSSADKNLQDVYGGEPSEVKRPKGASDGNEKPKEVRSDDNKIDATHDAGDKAPEAVCGILKNLQGSCGAKLDPTVIDGKLVSRG